jgi:hypothetical protein
MFVQIVVFGKKKTNNSKNELAHSSPRAIDDDRGGGVSTVQATKLQQQHDCD